MDIKKLFGFLMTEYNFCYEYQEFFNCYQGNWIAETHSFYNEHGCLTICRFPQVDDLNFYYSSELSTDFEKLREKVVNIRLIEPQIWNKYNKTGIISSVFSRWSNKKILNVFAEALEIHLSNGKNLFEIVI